MKPFFQKTVISIVAIAFLSSSFVGFVIPKKARAQAGAVPSFETNTSIITSVIGTLGTVGESLAQDLLDWAHKLLTEQLKRKLLDYLVDQVIAYIQGDGDPKYVMNWQDFLGGVAGDTAREFGLRFANIDLCSQFSDSIKLSFSGAPVPTFSQRAECTLDDIVGNISNFTDDFSSGGWIGYEAAWEPQNNFVGAFLTTSFALSEEIADAELAAQTEAIAGGGFLGKRECNEDSTSSGRDIDGDGNTGDIPSSCIITTPGSTIGSLVSDAFASDIDYIVNADDLDAYVSAIANAAMNRVLKEGFKLADSITARSTTSGSTGVSSYVDTSTVNELTPRKIQTDAKSLQDDLKAAIKAREDGQVVYDANTSTLILANAVTAKSALQYIITEMSKVSSSSHFINTGNSKCWAANSVHNIHRDRIPAAERLIDNLDTVVDVITEADDSGGTSANENEVIVLKNYLNSIDALLVTLAAGDPNDPDFFPKMIFQLTAIEAKVPSTFLIDARQFLRDVTSAKRTLLDTYGNFYGQTSRDEKLAHDLSFCLKPVTSGGVVTPFSASTVPSIPFPW